MEQKNDDLNATSTKIVTQRDGKVFIQLEGSHTTSTETETKFSMNKKIVKFEDEQIVKEQNLQQKQTKETKNFEKALEREENINEPKVFLEEKTADQEETKQQPAINFAKEVTKAHDCIDSKKYVRENNQTAVHQQKELGNTPSENKDASERFDEIIDLFDCFTKNLKSLELRVKSKKLTDKNAFNSEDNEKEQQLEKEAQKQQKQFEEYFHEDKKIKDFSHSTDAQKLVAAISIAADNPTDHKNEEHLKSADIVLAEQDNEANEKKIIISCSTSNATRSLGCQTQLSDQISLNELSLMEVSSLVSRTEQANSLNNYARADNACVSHYGSQQEIMKQPLIEIITEQPPTSSAVVPEPPVVPPFSVITIEANSRPSSIDLRRRPPFCQRLWEVLTDFCAATFLCLQVDKDCILCLAFFAAFVVSASFLTAFFYHTLIINPSLWEPEDNIRL